MNARELRIGNWLVYPGWRKDGSDALFMVRDLYYENEKIGLTTGVIQTRVDISHVKPIPLTKEYKDKIKHNENLLIDPSGFVIFKVGYAHQFIFEHYPFLHQLQNLYFALTGEELELKTENKKCMLENDDGNCDCPFNHCEKLGW